MKELRFAVSGTGFWTRYQILARMELSGVEFVALYNRTKSKTEALAKNIIYPPFTTVNTGRLKTTNENVDEFIK